MKGSGTHVPLSCVATGKLTPDSLYAYRQSNHKKLSTRSAHVRIFEAILFNLLPSFSIEKRNLLSSSGNTAWHRQPDGFASHTRQPRSDRKRVRWSTSNKSTTAAAPQRSGRVLSWPSKEPSLAANGLVRHGRECPCWYVRCGYWWDSYDSPRIWHL